MSYLYWNRFKRLSLPVFFLAAPAFAGGGALDVKCVDQGGNALSGVQVLVQQLGSGKWKDKKSDGKGVARFDKLDGGIYRVVARFFFQAEDGIRDGTVTGVQTCALPI